MYACFTLIKLSTYNIIPLLIDLDRDKFMILVVTDSLTNFTGCGIVYIANSISNQPFQC